MRFILKWHLSDIIKFVLGKQKIKKYTVSASKNLFAATPI